MERESLSGFTIPWAMALSPGNKGARTSFFNGEIPMAKTRKSKTKKPTAKKAKKPARRTAAKSRPAPARAKKPAPMKKQPITGEGDYVASNLFLKDQTAFVKRNKAKIPQLGRQAERALDGPEGASLRAAEQEAMSRSTIE